jgi:hypothetical protein
MLLSTTERPLVQNREVASILEAVEFRHGRIVSDQVHVRFHIFSSSNLQKYCRKQHTLYNDRIIRSSIGPQCHNITYFQRFVLRD